MKKTHPIDVVVVGSGITGLSALYHMRQLGVRGLALADDSATVAVSRRAAGRVTGGQIDNFTRVSHAHGSEFAAQLWAFGDAAYDALMAYSRAAGVPLATQRQVRLVTSEPELVEVRQAVAEMQAAGFAAQLFEPAAGHPYAVLLKGRVLAVQDDGPRGGHLDTQRLLETLSTATADVPRLGRVSELQADGQGVRLRLGDGKELRSEIAVVATHLGIRDLVPALHGALVSVADQWGEVELAGWQTPLPAALNGLCFSANHTYEWGVFLSDRRLRFGGGRYLRPLAGIEAETATVEDKITQHLLGQLAKTWAIDGAARSLTTQAALDIRPCDELPVIGPMFGNGRIMVATGYMGSGLTMGFMAGRCLAELAQTGRSDSLPRRLWPERLRTLEA